MFYREHEPPDFHAEYRGEAAKYSFNGAQIAGRIRSAARWLGPTGRTSLPSRYSKSRSSSSEGPHEGTALNIWVPLPGKHRARAWLAVSLLSAVLVTHAPSQLVYRADVQASSTYLWRGVNRANGFVLQSDLSIGWRSGRHSLAVGAWANSALTHDDHPEPTELDFWAQYAGGVNRVRWSAGALRYHFNRSNAADATDIYGQAFVTVGRLIPRLGIWTRASGGSGTYLEPSISFIHLLNPFEGPAFSWLSTLVAGIQTGNDGNIAPLNEQFVTTTGRGLTYVAVSTSARLNILIGLGSVFLSLAPRGQLSLDTLLRNRTGPSNESQRGPVFKFWLPLEVGITIPLRRGS